MTGCIACYSSGDSTSVVSRTVGSARISCNVQRFPMRSPGSTSNYGLGILVNQLKVSVLSLFRATVPQKVTWLVRDQAIPLQGSSGASKLLGSHTS